MTTAPGSAPEGAARRYATALSDVLGKALAEEWAHVAAASTIIANAWDNGGLLFVFGSGHSHMFAEEAFYRAGGAARICPILQGPYMLHEGAIRSTELEREPGHAHAILDRYRLDPDKDCLLIVSNSGSNALPVEMAVQAREAGIPVIAITSRAYAAAVSGPGPRLPDVADVVVDNHCPPGDALICLNDDPGIPAVGPGSTVIGLALLNVMVIGACAAQLEAGGRPDVFLSANMPGASQHNRALAADLKARVPHL